MSMVGHLTESTDRRYLQNPFAGTDLKYRTVDDSSQILGKIRNFIVLVAPILRSELQSSDNNMNIYTGKVGTALTLWKINKYLINDDAPLPDIAPPRHMSLRGHGIGFCSDVICWDMYQCLKTETPFAIHAGAYDNTADVSDEILFGRAGLALLIHYFVKKGMRHVNRHLVADILASISLTDYPWSWHNKVYFGAAHGTAGILTALRRLGGISRPDLLSDLLAQSRLPSGNFRSSMGSNRDKLVQWCHGAPGFTTLLLSYEQDAATEYTNVAATPTHPIADLKTVIHDTMEVIWQRGILHKGCSICHGTAGNGYSFLSTYLHTQDEEYLWRAVCFAEFILNMGATDCCATSDHPLSLFEGVSGTAQFLMDVAMVLEARQSTERVNIHSGDLFDGLAVF